MASYKTNSQKNTMRKYELPSTPGGYIFIPTKLGYGTRVEIRKEASQFHVEIDRHGVEQTYQAVDTAAAGKELLSASLLDPRTYHNLTDENDKPVQITRNWIESEMDEDDAAYLEFMLMANIQQDEETDEETVGETEPEVEATSTHSPENGSQNEELPKDKPKRSKEKTSSEPTLAVNQ